MKRLRMCVLSAAAALAVAAGLFPGASLAEDPAGFAPSTTGGALVAQDASIASGTWGTCPWEISADGTLTVHPGEGADIAIGDERSPWGDYASDVKAAVFACEEGNKVVAPAQSPHLLSGMNNMTSVDLSGLDTSNVASMYGMFAHCSSLVSLDLAGFDTANVTSMFGMFWGCSSLSFLDLSSFATPNLRQTDIMFSNCSSLRTIAVGSEWTTESISGSSRMFYECASLAGGNGTVYGEVPVGAVSARIDADGAPGYFTDVAELDKPDIGNAVIADIPDQVYTGNTITPPVIATYNGVKLADGTDYSISYSDNVGTGTATVKLARKNTYRGAVTATFKIVPPEGLLAGGVWGTCPWEISTDGTLTVHPGEGAKAWKYDYSQSHQISYWGDYSTSIKSVAFVVEGGRKVVAPEDSSYLLSYLTEVESVDLSGLDTSKVTDMSGMLCGCGSLASVYVDNSWSTDDVSRSYFMFSNCTSIVGGNGTSYDASHVDVGYARVDAEGTPGYLTYRAARPSVADAAIAPIPDQVYTGKAIEPAVTVTLGGSPLVAGTDYAVSYRDNVEVGTATVTVAGKGGYAGSKSATFAIVAPQGGDGPSGGGSGGEAAGEGEGGSGGGSASGGAADPGSGASADPSGEGSGGAADPSGASPEPDGPAKADPATFSGAAAAEGFADLAAGAWYMSEGFEDDSGRVVATYLDYTIGRGLMSGYSGTGRFGPDDTLTRGMGATIVYRMATGATAATTDNDVATRFSDVPRGAWYAAAVKWCSENGVVTGYAGTDRFGPDDPITREQLAAIIGRYMDPDGKAGADVSRFADASSIHGYARGGVAYCSSNGIMTGIGATGRFDPAGLATRCQMAKVIAVTASLEG